MKKHLFLILVCLVFSSCDKDDEYVDTSYSYIEWVGDLNENDYKVIDVDYWGELLNSKEWYDFKGIEVHGINYYGDAYNSYERAATKYYNVWSNHIIDEITIDQSEVKHSYGGGVSTYIISFPTLKDASNIKIFNSDDTYVRVRINSNGYPETTDSWYKRDYYTVIFFDESEDLITYLEQ